VPSGSGPSLTPRPPATGNDRAASEPSHTLALLAIASLVGAALGLTLFAVRRR
jgi:hypothetical protein